MSKKQRIILILLGIFFTSIIVGGVLILKHNQEQPQLSERAYLPTSEFEPEYAWEGDNKSTQRPTNTLPPTGSNPANPSATQTSSPTHTRSTICEGPPRMFLLAMGIDRRQTGYDYGLADVIRVVRVDFISGAVTVLTLPRDLWVKIPGLEGEDIYEGKLNQVYYYGSEYFGAYENPDYGPGLMIETLKLNFGLDIDRYITVNMQALEMIIDAIGGVDVTLQYSVDGKSTDPDDPFDLGYFPAGNHHFDGETAVRFARIRMMDNDYKRTSRQSLILKGLWEKANSPEILPKIPQLVTILSDYTQMNFQPKDIRPLICLVPLLDDQTLNFVNLPLEMLEESRVFSDQFDKTVFVYLVDENVMREMIRDFQRGLWPSQER